MLNKCLECRIRKKKACNPDSKLDAWLDCLKHPKKKPEIRKAGRFEYARINGCFILY